MTVETPETERKVGGCKPGMRGCRRRCGHRALVTEYRAARDAQLAQAEIEAVGYATELETFYADHPRTTFRWWLEQLAAGDDERERAAA